MKYPISNKKTMKKNINALCFKCFVSSNRLVKQIYSKQKEKFSDLCQKNLF